MARERLIQALEQQRNELADAADKESFEYRRLQTLVDDLARTIRFADGQIADNFATLLGWALTALWGALDALVHDLLSSTIANQSGALRPEIRGKLTIKYGEYMMLDGDELSERLLLDVEQQVGARLQSGVAGFEAALDAFRLAGDIDAELKRTLWEAFHVRNVIVHRAGVADRRLVRNCPWLKLTPGDLVKVGAEKYGSYLAAIREYGELLQDRVIERVVLNPGS
jgi:hypothetical protein